MNDNKGGRSSSLATCAGKELRQERPCRKGRCKQRGATGGSGNKAFHVVLPPKKESLKNPTVTSSSNSNNSNQQQSDVRVLLSLNSIFYSSWSRWSSCSKACTTTRFRFVLIGFLLNWKVGRYNLLHNYIGRAVFKWFAAIQSFTKKPTVTRREPTARNGTAVAHDIITKRTTVSLFLNIKF